MEVTKTAILLFGQQGATKNGCKRLKNKRLAQYGKDCKIPTLIDWLNMLWSKILVKKFIKYTLILDIQNFQCSGLANGWVVIWAHAALRIQSLPSLVQPTQMGANKQTK